MRVEYSQLMCSWTLCVHTTMGNMKIPALATSLAWLGYYLVLLVEVLVTTSKIQVKHNYVEIVESGNFENFHRKHTYIEDIFFEKIGT